MGWAFLPFNGGPRICLGQQFALTEASYVLVRLAQCCENLQLTEGIEYPPAKLTHLTMCMFDGVLLKLISFVLLLIDTIFFATCTDPQSL